MTRIDNLTLLIKSEKPVSNQDDPLNIKEAANYLNLNKSTLYNKVNKREIPFMKRGKRIYFLKSELKKYIKRGKVLSIDEIEGYSNNFLSNNNKS